MLETKAKYNSSLLHITAETERETKVTHSGRTESRNTVISEIYIFIFGPQFTNFFNTLSPCFGVLYLYFLIAKNNFPHD